MDYHKFVPNTRGAVAPSQRVGLASKSAGVTYGDVVKIALEHAQPTAVTGQSRLQGDENYFIGNNPSRWASGAHRYQEARYENPYPGIAVRLYFDQNKPRYDIVVQPGADPSQVAFKIEGAENAKINDNGSLELQTPYGTIEEQGLVAYQVQNRTKTQIACRMSLEGNHLRFDPGQYDPSKPLVIDPLIFSTNLSGSEVDDIYAMKRDKSGNIIVAGGCTSANFPVTVGAYQTTTISPAAFVSKLDSTCSHLLASTRLGGTGFTSASALTLDSEGNPMITGTTEASNFPTTAGAFQTKNEGDNCAFVAKLSADGTQLLMSTLLGGSTSAANYPLTYGNALALDASGNPVVAGQTYASNFPTTTGAYQKSLKCLGGNAFISKLSADGTQLLASTLLGGVGIVDSDARAGHLGESAFGVAVDSLGNFVLTGQTYSTDFPVTAGAYKTTKTPNAAQTGFVAKLSPDCTTLLASTYLGGSGQHFWVSGTFGDTPYALALDSANNPVVVGSTYSLDFPTTTGAFQTTNHSTYYNAFVSKISSDFTSLLASTYLGGSGTTGVDFYTGDQAMAVLVDSEDNPVVAGYTDSKDFPATANAFQTVNNGGSTFVCKFNPLETQLVFSGFLGSGGGANSVALDLVGNPIIAGVGDVPITAQAYEQAAPGVDSFISDLSFPSLYLNAAPDSVVGGTPVAGTVGLMTAAGSPRAVISLSSNNSAVVVPATVEILAGTKTVTFPIRTKPVGGPVTATITATDGAQRTFDELPLSPATLASFTILSRDVVGGERIMGEVGLTSEAGAAGDVVKLSYSPAGLATMPSFVTVPPGGTYAEFPIQTVYDPGSCVTLTAQFGSVTKTTSFILDGCYPISMTITPSIVKGGSPVEVLLRCISLAPESGIWVYLNWTAPLSVPDYVTVPSGASKFHFQIKTPVVKKNTTVSLTANGGITQTFTITP